VNGKISTGIIYGFNDFFEFWAAAEPPLAEKPE
jgi:hypothetical protein